VLSGEATNTNFIVFGLTPQGFDPTIYHTQVEQALNKLKSYMHLLAPKNTVKTNFTLKIQILLNLPELHGVLIGEDEPLVPFLLPSLPPEVCLRRPVNNTLLYTCRQR
jgi:hypothetical protein